MLQTTWGAFIGTYLFLGGMSAGAFITATVLYLKSTEEHQNIIATSMWAATLCLIFGLLLLVGDLINPMQGMALWSAFSHWTTWMTYGAWGAFAAIIFFGLSALLATDPIRIGIAAKWNALNDHMETVRKVLALCGAGFACFVAVYTGMLLMTAQGVPLWNTPLLPCLFTVSAFDTGVALVEIIALFWAKREQLSSQAHVRILKTILFLVLIESVVVIAFIGSLSSGNAADPASATAASSIAMLTSGTLAPYFWIAFVALGLACPLAAAAVGLIPTRKTSSALVAIGAAGALVGGCELRFLILAAGVHADIIATTIGTIL